MNRTCRTAWRIAALAGLLPVVAAAPARAVGARAGEATAATDALCDLGQPTVIECNSGVTTTLSADDCFFPDTGAFFDPWVFEGTAGSVVTIRMTSDDFDTALALTDDDLNIVAFDDDGGGGTNSRLIHALNRGGLWGIAAGGFSPADVGRYTLVLECSEPVALSFLGGRFLVTVDWRLSNGQSGVGRPLPITDKAGLFYFFAPENLEMLIKVLDGCGLNDRFWVFFAATTNVEFTVTVLDTETGQRRTYRNPPDTAARPVQDTSAFATCP